MYRLCYYAICLFLYINKNEKKCTCTLHFIIVFAIITAVTAIVITVIVAIVEYGALHTVCMYSMNIDYTYLNNVKYIKKVVFILSIYR